MAVLLDLESIIADFSDEMKRNFRFIYSLSLLPNPKVAFHAADADGVVSASILKSLKEFQDAVFIPLGFQEIRQKNQGKRDTSKGHGIGERKVNDLQRFCDFACPP